MLTYLQVMLHVRVIDELQVSFANQSCKGRLPLKLSKCNISPRNNCFPLLPSNKLSSYVFEHKQNVTLYASKSKNTHPKTIVSHV